MCRVDTKAGLTFPHMSVELSRTRGPLQVTAGQEGTLESLIQVSLDQDEQVAKESCRLQAPTRKFVHISEPSSLLNQNLVFFPLKVLVPGRVLENLNLKFEGFSSEARTRLWSWLS